MTKTVNKLDSLNPGALFSILDGSDPQLFRILKDSKVVRERDFKLSSPPYRTYPKSSFAGFTIRVLCNPYIPKDSSITEPAPAKVRKPRARKKLEILNDFEITSGTVIPDTE